MNITTVGKFKFCKLKGTLTLHDKLNNHLIIVKIFYLMMNAWEWIFVMSILFSWILVTQSY